MQRVAYHTATWPKEHVIISRSF